MNNWNELHQKLRRELFYNKYLESMREAISASGEWCGEGPRANFRETLWHCLPLMHSEHGAERANRIIEAIPTAYCHFSPMTSMQLLLKHRERLSSAAVHKLEAYVKGSLTKSAEDNIHFTMYNDNFAAMAAFSLLAAGEYFGDAVAFEAGAVKLAQMKP
jgi:hypothetical protein